MKRKKSVELLHLYELLNVVGIETFNTLAFEGREFVKEWEIKRLQHGKVPDAESIASNHLENVNEKILALDNLRDYCNKRFAKISVTYNQKVTEITDLWQIQTKKYKISDVK